MAGSTWSPSVVNRPWTMWCRLAPRTERPFRGSALSFSRHSPDPILHTVATCVVVKPPIWLSMAWLRSCPCDSVRPARFPIQRSVGIALCGDRVDDPCRRCQGARTMTMTTLAFGNLSLVDRHVEYRLSTISAAERHARASIPCVEGNVILARLVGSGEPECAGPSAGTYRRDIDGQAHVVILSDETPVRETDL